MVLKDIRRLNFLYQQLTPREFFTAIGKHFVQKTLHKDNHALFCALIVLIDQADKEAPAVKVGNVNRIQASLNGQSVWVTLRRNTSDFFIYNQIFIRRDYDHLISEITRRIPAEDIRYIIDAGANIGCATLMFRSYFKEAVILAVEPEHSNFGLLKKNVEGNALPEIVLVEGALWHKDEPLTLDMSFRDGSHSAVTVRQSVEAYSLTVEGYTVSSLLQAHQMPHIDLLKIDIEGAEKYLFSDKAGLNTFLPITRCLAVEVHEEFISEEEVTGVLESYGFECSKSGEYIIAFNNIFNACHYT